MISVEIPTSFEYIRSAMDKRIYNEAGKAGLIMGLSFLVITGGVYAIDYTMFASFWFGILNLILVVGFLIYFYGNWRKGRGGYVSFKESFAFGFLALVMSGVINLMFTCILYGVIDPDLPTKLTDALIDNTVGMLERFGAPDAQIDETIEQLEKQTESYTLEGQLKNFPMMLVMYAGFALIMGAIYKKERPPFEDAAEG